MAIPAWNAKPQAWIGPTPVLSPAGIRGDVLEATSPPCSVTAPGTGMLLLRHHHIPQPLQGPWHGEIPAQGSWHTALGWHYGQQWREEQ